MPPHVGHRGWVGLRLDRDVGRDRVADLINDAYRMVAPKQLFAQLAP